MTQEMNRRGFFKATAVTGSLFLTGDILREGDFSQGLVKIPESEKMVITVITDNLADALRPDDKIARRHTGTASPLEGMLHAEHGLAYHVETVSRRPVSFLSF